MVGVGSTIILQIRSQVVLLKKKVNFLAFYFYFYLFSLVHFLPSDSQFSEKRKGQLFAGATRPPFLVSLVQQNDPE
jgi:hypothetical protein